MTTDRYRRFRRNSSWLVGGIALGLLVPTSSGHAQRAVTAHARLCAPPPRADDARYDPRASALLKRMGDAYSRLGAFDLRIEISSALISLDTAPDSTALSTVNVDPTPFHVDESKLRPQAHLHMAFRQSNQLLMETEQADPTTGKSFDLRWVCDGRYFWSYAGDKKVYTREKAPGNIHDFARLQYLGGGTLELIMLIGPNPFADLLQSVEGAHLIGESSVRGIPTEVVSLQMEDPLEQSELRLYIGKSDGLLHRMEIESIPVKLHDGPIKVGSKLDALLEAGKPVPLQDENSSDPDAPKQEPVKPHKPVGSFLRFENDLTMTSGFPSGTFAFTPPQGSLMLGEQGAVKRLTAKQRIAMLVKNAKQKRLEMLRNGQTDE
jgi:hypothetical protein